MPLSVLHEFGGAPLTLSVTVLAFFDFLLTNVQILIYEIIGCTHKLPAPSILQLWSCSIQFLSLSLVVVMQHLMKHL